MQYTRESHWGAHVGYGKLVVGGGPARSLLNGALLFLPARSRLNGALLFLGDRRAGEISVVVALV